MEVIKMPKNRYRRFDSYDSGVRSNESSSETLNRLDPPEDKIQVAVEKETEEIARPEKIEPVKEERVISCVDGKVNVLCNMRETPRITGSNILCVLKVDTPIKIYEYPGEFYKVNYNGQFGYIKKDLCDKI